MIRTFTLLFTLLGGLAMATPEPSFKLIKQNDDFSVRAYPAQLAADVVLSGPDATQNQAFRILADYIFKDYPTGQVGMTAPVTTATQQIGMTAPVTTSGQGKTVFMRFFMPERYTSSTLPKPEDPRIKVVEIPARKVAVVTFNGWWSDSKAAKQEKRLRKWATAQGLQVAGEIEQQQFNPPWTLPWWRRNELWLPVK